MDLVRRSVALAVVAALSVGCSGEEPEPKLAPSTESAASTPSGSASVTPDEPPPVTPTPVSTRKGQREFIVDFFAAATRAISSGDVREFMSMASPRCQSCQTLATNLTAAYAGGGRIEGGRWTVESARYEKRSSIGSIWRVKLATAREQWLDADGNHVKTVRADMLQLGLALAWQSDSWQVREMRLR